MPDISGYTGNATASATPGVGELGGFAINTTNPESPDYQAPAYRQQSERWQTVNDVREGTDAIRLRRGIYLPRFSSEDGKDWDARVNMSYATDVYASTLTDHIGLVFAQAPKLEGDVPDELATLLEDADGEGSHWHVFARRALESGLHYGHAAIWTDYPAVSPDEPLRLDQQQARKLRPYWTLITAPEIVSWRTVRIGGVEVLTKFVRREHVSTDAGRFGTAIICQYRVVQQDVLYDGNGTASGLGGITWAVWQPVKDTQAGQGGESFVMTAEGTIEGPERIPLRIFYCGERFGTLHSKPFLYDLAITSLEETQVSSDYAAVMHRCNIPTPVFSGLVTGEEVNMSAGVNLPLHGTATYMEPKGTALAATRQRLEDIKLELIRQGAVAQGGDLLHGRTMTATEAAQIARQRNARLSSSARNLQDAMEGALDDMADFLGIGAVSTKKRTAQASTSNAFKGKTGGKADTEGGSILINQDFAGSPVDPAFMMVVMKAFEDGVLTRDETRYALQNGELPEDEDPETTAAILDAIAAAKDEAAAQAAADKRAQFDAMAASGGAPGKPSGKPAASDAPIEEAA